MDQYSVALHLRDEQNNVIAQADYSLPLGAFAHHTAYIPIDDGGEYTLIMIVYRWQTGERLTSEQGEFFTLEQFE